tara:strand:+ start:473 stop:967 length:495 start_codon:yes stop_codon:yes gene_type:complete
MAFDNTVVGAPKGYGRTRRPKELWNDSVVSNKQAATTVTVVVSTALNDDITDTTSGENGYSTENQRYLHLQLTGDDDDSYDVTIYGYNYAFGAWAKLYTLCRGAPAANPTVETSYDPALYSTMDSATGGPKQFTIEIAGIDRIALTADTNDIAKITARMACSTF